MRPLVLALATLCLPSLSACERKGEASESQAAAAPLQAELRVAPVADAHPWVMAFVTQTSITRPHGVDARLEGVTGPAGSRAPDPIIEAESREDLASWLETYAAQHPRPPELLPVYEADPFGPEHHVHARLYFVEHGRGFVVDSEARARLETHAHGPSVHVAVGPAQAQALEQLTSELIGHRLAVSSGDRALMLPVVMEALVGGDIQLLTQTSLDPQQTAPALLTQLTGAQ